MKSSLLLIPIYYKQLNTLAMPGERFYVRLLGRKCNDKLNVTIYIRVKRDNERGRILYSTGIKCPAKQFSAARQAINDETINTIVQHERLRVLRTIFTLKESGQPVYLHQVKAAIIQPPAAPVVTIGTISEEVLAEHAKNVTPRTHQSVRSCLTNLIDLLKWQKRPVVSISSDELEAALLDIKPHYRHSSFIVCINYLRWVFDRAKRKRIIASNPFDLIDMKQITKTKRVTQPEKPAFSDIQTAISASGNAKVNPHFDDMAFFQLMSGMAFVDVVTLTPDMIMERDGVFYIVKERQKSKVPFLVPIDAETVAVFRRNEGFADVEYPAYYYYLKRRYGITTHTLRHARARDLLNKGLSLEAVAGMLGHTNISMTIKYAPIRGRKMSDDEVDRVLGRSG